MIRTALDVLLRETEFEILGTAATGEETLQQVERLKPDAVLLDLQMPGGTGMEVLRKLDREAQRRRRSSCYRRHRRFLAARGEGPQG